MANNEKISIKSYKNGLRLILSPEADFDEIIDELSAKCSQAKNFFGDASVVLSFEGRDLFDSQEEAIIAAITKNCDLKIVCVCAHNDDKEKDYQRIIDNASKKMSDTDESAVFYKGTIKDSQVVKVDKSIVVLGDVNPGCSVIAGGDIIILGGLYGEAHAGRNSVDPHTAFVAALDMSPSLLTISDVIHLPAEKPKWGLKAKVAPKVAHISQDEPVILFDNLTRQALEKIYVI